MPCSMVRLKYIYSVIYVHTILVTVSIQLVAGNRIMCLHVLHMCDYSKTTVYMLFRQ